jgi:hypothetical protein
MTRWKTVAALILMFAPTVFCGGRAAAQNVGKQPPITIEINSSPWYAGFEAAVDRYE